MNKKRTLFFTWLLMIAVLGHVVISASEFFIFLLEHNAQIYITLYIALDTAMLVAMTVLYYKAILEKEEKDINK